MQPKTVTQSLIDRLHFWEDELDIDRSAHPEPAQRLDAMIEQMIDDEAMALAANNELRSERDELRSEVTRQNRVITTLQKVIADQNESVAQLTKDNRRYARRWSMLRKLLGIRNIHEESWE